MNEVRRCAAAGIRVSSFALIEDYFYLGLVNFVEEMARVSQGIAAYCSADDLGKVRLRQLHRRPEGPADGTLKQDASLFPSRNLKFAVLTDFESRVQTGSKGTALSQRALTTRARRMREGPSLG